MAKLISPSFADILLGKNPFARFQHMTVWQLWFFSVVLSILLTEAIVAIMGLLLKGEVPLDYLLTGLVASCFVASLVVAIVGYFIEKLLESQRQLHAIIEAEPECVKILNAEGSMLGMNRAGLNMLGADSPDQIIGQPIQRFVLPDYSHSFMALIQHVFEGMPDSLEFEIEKIDGTKRWLDTHAVPLCDSHGHILALLAVTRDITERKQVNEALHLAKEAAEQAALAKAHFLANMSHEIRTPMNAILGFSELGVNERSLGVMKNYMGIIHQAANSLLGIIDDILDFSKLDSGKLILEQAPFDLGQLLDEVKQLLSLKADAKRLALHFNLGNDVPQSLVGDALRLRQILINLLSNAVKFTKSGHVSVIVQPLSRDASHVVLQVSVADTGIGMTETQMADLFQPFSQADNSTTRQYGGTGLGLAITRQLVQSMGGEIVCRSSPGVGSTFIFTVSLLLDRKPVTLEVPVRLPRQGARILLVEDNTINQMVAEALLEKMGLSVTLANDGEEAIRLLGQAPAAYDLVLMDIQMPNMSGYDATRAIREDLGLVDLPIIAMTAYAMEEEKQRCLSVGMNDHIAKPISLKILQNTLNHWLPPN